MVLKYSENNCKCLFILLMFINTMYSVEYFNNKPMFKLHVLNENLL